jgi:hypothetical protein
VGDFFDQTLSLRQETPATLDERLACGRQGDVAAVSDEQRDAEALLQAADLGRERLLGDDEPVRGPAEMEFISEGDNVAHLAKIEVHLPTVTA